MLGFGPDTKWMANSTGSCGGNSKLCNMKFPKIKNGNSYSIADKMPRNAFETQPALSFDALLCSNFGCAFYFGESRE